MRKRKPEPHSAGWDFLEGITPSRKSKLRKLDHQDVTITSALVRLPVKRPYDARVNTREPPIANKGLERSCDEIDQLAVRLAFLSLETRCPFEAPRPTFPKFPLLPTEIRLMIWKFARPDPRIVKFSRSTKQTTGCGFQHLVSRVPVPNLLHACYESRSLALRWYTLLFRPTCGFGGTYIDRAQDYMYYGSNQRVLLTGSRSPEGIINWHEWTKDTRRWAKDRQSIRNIVIHEQNTSPRHPFTRLLDLTRLCNEFAKGIVFLGPLCRELIEGTMVSDLKNTPNAFPRHQHSELEAFKYIYKGLRINRKQIPGLKEFRPKRICTAGLIHTNNVMQNYAFRKKVFENLRLDFSFQSEGIKRVKVKHHRAIHPLD